MIRIFVYISLFFSLPIFYDLYFMEFVFSEEPFGHETMIPIPVGFMAFLIVFPIFYINSLIQKDNFTRFFSNQESFVIQFTIFALFFHGYFFSGLSIVRIIQILIPFVFFLLMSMPNSRNYRLKFFNSALYVFIVFTFLHFVSLTIYNNSLFKIGSLEFPMFFGTSIYQSLVSYPAVLSLYLTLMVYIIFNQSNNVVYKLSIAIITFLLLTTARKAALFEMFFLLAFNILIVPLIVSYKMVFEKWLKVLGFILFSLACFTFLLFETPALKRLFNSLENNTFTGGRDDIFSKALNLISNDFLGFLFGFGDGEFSFHNFIIDLVFRLGIIATIIYLIVLFFIFIKIISITKKTGDEMRIWFVICVMVQFLIQLMVNSPLTQPYYLANFCFILLYFMYYPLSKKTALL